MFTIDPRVLGAASRDLIRHGLHIDDECQIPMPESGRTDCQAQQAVDRLVDRSSRLADALRDLGDGLDRVVSDASAADGRISMWFDLAAVARVS